jgi:hypothetical protein
MTLLAEISDKMPSISGILAIALAAAVVCGGIALVNRSFAWAMLLLTLLVGGLLAYVAFDEAFVSGPMRDAVWGELGWPWVLSDMIGPLLPAVCVALVVFFQRRRSAARRQLVPR